MALGGLLDPTFGLAVGHQLARMPEPPHLICLEIDVGLRSSGTDTPTIHDMAGAHGLTVRDVYARGVGEAVERLALNVPADDPVPSRIASRRELDAEGGEVARPDAWPGFPHPGEDMRIKWRTAVSYPSGTPLLVPAAWIDWPCPSFLGSWEGSPSGAAAHLTISDALEAAFSELVERDAEMTAWFTGRGVTEVDLSAGLDSACRTSRNLLRLLEAQPEVRKRLFRIPTCVPGLSAYIGWVCDERVAGAGGAVGWDEKVAMLRALREAWQVRLSLQARGPVEHWGLTEAELRGYFDRGELRCRYWASGEGLGVMTEWAAERPLVAPADATPGQERPSVLQGLVEEAIPLAYVDLTPRLPAAIRDAGFVAVKAIAAGLQPLIFTEDEPWAYVPERVACTEEHLRLFQPVL